MIGKSIGFDWRQPVRLTAWVCLLTMGCAHAQSSGGAASGLAGAAASAAGGAVGAHDRPIKVQSPMIDSQLQAMVRIALDDAARRTQRDASSLVVALAESVMWPDGSLGCPQPDMGYTQALVPGYRIRIQAGSETLEYHASGRGQPFYCPPARITAPVPARDPRI